MVIELKDVEYEKEADNIACEQSGNWGEPDKKYTINDEQYSADYIKKDYNIDIDNTTLKINEKYYDEVTLETFNENRENKENKPTTSTEWENLFILAKSSGELIFEIKEIIEIYEFGGILYEFFWDTESEHFFVLEALDTDTTKYFIIKLTAYNDEVEIDSFISGEQGTERYEKDLEQFDNLKLGEYTLIITEEQKKNLIEKLNETE
jgi:hypothetical protein